MPNLAKFFYRLRKVFRLAFSISEFQNHNTSFQFFRYFDNYFRRLTMPPKRRSDAIDESDTDTKRRKTSESTCSAPLTPVSSQSGSSRPTSSAPISFPPIPSSLISTASESGSPNASRSIGLARPRWTSNPGSLMVGDGPAHTDSPISANMKTSVHGWRFMDGFKIVSKLVSFTFRLLRRNTGYYLHPTLSL